MTGSQPDPEAEWWTIPDVAAYLGVRPDTVSSYRSRGQMPGGKLIGRTRIWKPAEIIKWRPKSR